MGAAVPGQDRHRRRGRGRELIGPALAQTFCKDAAAPGRSYPRADWTKIARPALNIHPGQEDAMGKEKNKGGKEARKPKKEVPKTIAANPSTKGAPTSK
jgi:hypothetical protein